MRARATNQGEASRRRRPPPTVDASRLLLQALAPLERVRGERRVGARERGRLFAQYRRGMVLPCPGLQVCVAVSGKPLSLAPALVCLSPPLSQEAGETCASQALPLRQGHLEAPGRAEVCASVNRALWIWQKEAYYYASRPEEH